ncbi:MAG: ParB/RepB/Spo0J family partition protein [Thermoproteota archaeon]
MDKKFVGVKEVEVSRILFVKSGRLNYPIPVDDLVEDIRRNGLLQPIVVEEVENGYMVLAGGRRYFACKELGMEKVKAAVYRGLSREERLAIIVGENVKRQNFSVIEQATLIKEYVSLGHSVDEAARFFSLHDEEVKNLLYVLDTLPDAVRNVIVRFGEKVSLDQCVLLAKLVENGFKAEDVERYARDVAKGTVSTETLRSLVERRLPPVQARPPSPPPASPAAPESFTPPVQATVSPPPPPPQSSQAPSPAPSVQENVQAEPVQSTVQEQRPPVQQTFPSYTAIEESSPQQIEFAQKTKFFPEHGAVYTLEFTVDSLEKHDRIYGFFCREDGELDGEKLYQTVLAMEELLKHDEVKTILGPEKAALLSKKLA